MGFEPTHRKYMEKKAVTNYWKLNALQAKVSWLVYQKKAKQFAFSLNDV